MEKAKKEEVLIQPSEQTGNLVKLVVKEIPSVNRTRHGIS